MKVLYFDCFSGISGDMTLGALIDLGIDRELFLSELDKLNLAGYEIRIENSIKNGITGTDVHVILNSDYEEYSEKRIQHEHESHDHHHGHEHHEHRHHMHHHEHNSRNLKDIEELIDASELKLSIKEFSKKVFDEIARAEAKVHNKSVNEVHFHEVGAIDSIVDIVGTAICLDLLGVQKVYSSPLHDGKGFVECQHGKIPVPVPAVLEMLKGSKIPLITENIDTELVTPTGMGIIKCLADDFGNMPAILIDRIGYGMGKRDTGGFNALRVVMGTLFGQDEAMEEIAVLETNIDDMNPEMISYTMEKLFEAEALDVFFTPVYMKKNRPAVVVTVLCNPSDERKLVDIILKETTSLGVRRSLARRHCMHRETISINTEYGEVDVKIASQGDYKKYAPEYEACRSIAKSKGIELQKVYSAACEGARKIIQVENAVQ